MTERGGDRIAKRIFVSVSKKSPQWSQALSSDKEIVNLAIGHLNSNAPSTQIVDADAMLVVKEIWPMRIWIVFDIFNINYDPSKAHLPNQNDLPVIAISLSKNTSVTVASIGLRDKVNQGVRDAHDLHGSVEVLRLMWRIHLPTVSPQCSALSGLRLDPALPKDLGLFYESDCLGGCFALVLYDPEIVSSWKGSEFLTSELSEPAASQQDVRDRLSSSPAGALGIDDAWYSSAEEEILESDLFRAHLDQTSSALWRLLRLS
ncbi:hypothetical protein CORC01_13274 [Colletotrichum orchidophilum]|uniref:Uncharacterized protein n=1 Tax=Colletotrichum orchidophilum TaxID=1209926 RepID=A0A1G4AQH3_9PEZI|nr:uncharacterized protein CORC01_13274 [Colletotrichum orchidophilum]OHE91409.1 hypothetical protein CORC01_13274 [Colletotrichum orchidophilum]